MRPNATKVSVFVASPSDVQDERQRIDRVKDELNAGLSHFSVFLDVQRWETRVRPGVGDRVQDVILEQIGPYDVFVGIMWHRLGTDTGRAPSGTVEEFNVAYSSYEAHGRPQIMFYFNDAPVPPSELDPDQLKGVQGFRDGLPDQGMLWWPYNGPDDFEAQVRRHLLGKLTEMVAGTQEDPQEKERSAPDAAETDVGDGPEVEDLLDLRLRLESKMAWLCKHLLAGPDAVTYATIGSLRYDGYLGREDARLAARLLAFSGHAPDPADRGEIKKLGIAAGPLVASFRAIVFDAHVRKALRRMGYEPTDLDQPPGPRPDFVATTKDGRTFRIVPRLVTSSDSAIRDRAIKRLTKHGADPPVARRIVVVPDASGAKEDEPSADPGVVKFANLASALDE